MEPKVKVLALSITDIRSSGNTYSCTAVCQVYDDITNTVLGNFDVDLILENIKSSKFDFTAHLYERIINKSQSLGYTITTSDIISML